MTTLEDWINETKALLYSGQEQETNYLDTTINTSATTFAVEFDLGSITRGAVISIGLEDIRIKDASGSSVTDCVRGVNGTTAAAHTAGDLIEVRPKFSPFSIVRALNQDLADLSSPANGLFKVVVVDPTYNASVQAYNLTSATAVEDILEVRYKLTGPSGEWPIIKQYDLLRDMDTDDFASGFAISLRETAQPGQPLRVWYAAPFTAATVSLSYDVAGTGLPTSAMDLPPLGAVIKLVSAREINRNFMESQSDPRRAEEVPPGAVGQSVRNIEIIRQRRIVAEAARLQSNWHRTR